jgi:hypothetical protein
MAKQSDAKRKWREVTLADSDEGSSSSDGSSFDSGGSTSFESIEVTPTEKRKPHIEEEDPTFDLMKEAKASRLESSDEDTGERPKVLAYQ